MASKVNTIKMWGEHINSLDTQEKLRRYQEAKLGTPQRFKDSTIMFGYSLDKPWPKYMSNAKASKDQYKFNSSRTIGQDFTPAQIDNFTDVRNLALKAKREGFRDILPPTTLTEPYPTTPYIDVAILPNYKRPKTFIECVDFFYPLSGVKSYLATQSPFLSTAPNHYTTIRKAAYGFDPFDVKGTLFLGNRQRVIASDMPPDLGDLTMMYSWFIIYRLLLCPKSLEKVILPDADKLFGVLENKEQRFINEEIVAKAEKNLDQTLRNFQNLKTAVRIVKDVSSKVAAGKIDSVNDLKKEIHNNKELKAFIFEGVGKIASSLAKTFGVKESSTRALAGWIVERSIKPEVFKKLPTDAKNQIDAFANGQIEEALGVIAEQEGVSKIELPPQDNFILRNQLKFGELPLSEHNKLSSNGKKVSLYFASEEGDKYYGDYKDAFNSLKQAKVATKDGARENGLVAALAIQGAGIAIDKLIDKQMADAKKRLSQIQKYFTSLTTYLDASLAEEGVSFALDTFESKGFKVDANNGVPFSDDKDWGEKPYCNPMNGGMVRKYFVDLYRNFKPFIEEMRRSVFDSLDGKPANVRSLLLRRVDILNKAGVDVNAQTSGWPCWTFDIFLKNYAAIDSTRYVFRDLPNFSPFTQAYGFEPTFLDRQVLVKGGNGAILTELNREWGTNTDLVISGSPYENGWLYTHPSNRAYITPGASRVEAVIGSMDDSRVSLTAYHNKPLSSWKTSDLQALELPEENSGSTARGAHFRTINSQRKITDEVGHGYMGFTGVTFDVAYQNFPIMNAQWPALCSVIFCYPEALDTMAIGYDWAKNIKNEKLHIQRLQQIALDNEKANRAQDEQQKDFIDKVTFIRSQVANLPQVDPRVKNAQSQMRNFQENMGFRFQVTPQTDIRQALREQALEMAAKIQATSDESSEEAKATNDEQSSGVLATVLGLSALGAAAYAYRKYKRKS